MSKIEAKGERRCRKNRKDKGANERERDKERERQKQRHRQTEDVKVGETHVLSMTVDCVWSIY